MPRILPALWLGNATLFWVKFMRNHPSCLALDLLQKSFKKKVSLSRVNLTLVTSCSKLSFSCSVCCCSLEKASCIHRQPFNRHLLPLQAFIKELEWVCWHLSWVSWHQATKGSKALYYTLAELGALCQTINWAVACSICLPWPTGEYWANRWPCTTSC